MPFNNKNVVKVIDIGFLEEEFWLKCIFTISLLSPTWVRCVTSFEQSYSASPKDVLCQVHGKDTSTHYMPYNLCQMQHKYVIMWINLYVNIKNDYVDIQHN